MNDLTTRRGSPPPLLPAPIAATGLGAVAVHLPHYGHAAALIGPLVLLTVVIILAIAIARSGK
ncbi:hypothetical protein SAMN05421505_111166 [Sinosporangium album]|uniref:Uncharacterized protein n=1 Tax=Sinosporangium album TaxID=504805 RepID=A0A1G7ZR24_9ACTN|nr:hypothetical protein [Sinosporangium album]SDH11144.1 hypothetical protein SAMN05421505_111166 [Sinosporangium album]